MKRNEKITIQLDGDSWCATRENFINLQESLAGFGDTEEQALFNLIQEEIIEDTILQCSNDLKKR